MGGLFINAKTRQTTYFIGIVYFAVSSKCEIYELSFLIITYNSCHLFSHLFLVYFKTDCHKLEKEVFYNLNLRKERLYELDALRGLAVIGVMLSHYTTRYENLFGHVKNPYLLDFPYGGLGVPLFFIISGFVIYMTILNSQTIKDFAIKRITRLYPAYIVAVILTFTLVTLYQLQGREVSLKHALINLTMFQGFLVGVPNVDGAYWSLTVEISFYMLIGFIVFLGFHRKIEYISIAWLLAAALFKIIVINFDNVYLHAIESQSINNYCHLFIAGIMFYHLRNANRYIYHIIISLCLIYQFVFNDFVTSLFVSLFFVLFYALVFKKFLKIFNIKPLIFLGTISYSLYLIHQNIGYIVINILEKNGFTSEFYLIVPFAVSIILAYLITFYIEKPLMKFFREKYRRSNTKTKTTVAS